MQILLSIILSIFCIKVLQGWYLKVQSLASSNDYKRSKLMVQHIRVSKQLVGIVVIFFVCIVIYYVTL